MRLKRGTPSGDRAAEKWHATMLERLGSEEAIREHYRTIGRKGGQRSHNGGFASDKVGKDGLTGRERSRIAGRKAGKISKIGYKYLGTEGGKNKYLDKNTGKVVEFPVCCVK